MKKIILFVAVGFLFGCNKTKQPGYFTSLQVKTIFTDSVSIRAISFTKKRNALFYAGTKGKYGYINLDNPGQQVQYTITYKSFKPGFRSVASTSSGDFLLSAGNPALLYKTTRKGKDTLTYIERDSSVFYDSMAFWNTQEGIAIGDPVGGCLSIIITRNGGNTWEKVPCSHLPKIAKGEFAFAASNTNIAIVNDKTWMITGGSQTRVFFSPDKGKTWKVYDTPLIHGKPTTGGYTIDFYNENIGVIYGGDYTKPQQNKRNKAITTDGGKTWHLIANGKPPGYRSCVQFVPGSNGNGIVAVGPSGISYSHDAGKNWKEMYDEGFYTVRFLNDSVAYAAGKNRIARLVFEKGE